MPMLGTLALPTTCMATPCTPCALAGCVCESDACTEQLI